MAPMNNSSSNLHSSNYGEAVARQANVLASCYVVDPSASLKGYHYCTTVAAGAECPPLAAITKDNELALAPKKKRSSATNSSTTSRSRRGGATSQIREECERFFCETMKTVFQVEGTTASNGSGLTDVYYNTQLATPPAEYPTPPSSFSGSDIAAIGWMEFWDYVGGASFRAFVAEDSSEKTLFAFLDAGLLGRELKPAVMALLELAESPLDCSQVVICLDRSMPEDDARDLIRSFQWVGFKLTTLDQWAKGYDVISDKWLFMAMEV
ncbi:ornithine decarboxylase antizyme-domain-containing protein [Xylariales sp. PMI_506]|nr:ornithine decarboxylase antizyme-domain-containing protein [Xylariales sp. PMI_506]